VGWKSEARMVMQKKYSRYCKKQRAEGKEPMPYHKFVTLEEKRLNK
jgi:hypothetical protein